MRLTLRHRFIKDCDGVTAIEFAFVVPVLLLIMMGIIEFALIMFTQTVMESATITTSRLGKTGYVAAGLTRQQEITNSIVNRMGVLIDPSKISISTLVYSNFDKIGKPEPCITASPCNGTAGVNFVDVNGNGSWDQDMGAAGLGNAGDIVVYTVSYDWPITTPIVSTIIGSKFTITSRTVVKNEPY